MGTIGFTEEEIDAIKRIIAAILHLGNVQFTSKGDDECQVKNAEVLGRVATLLRYTLFYLLFCLLSTSVLRVSTTILTYFSFR